MAEAPRFSPIIYDYLKKYQDDPTSRVFAPLAEAYRKAGMIDEAIEICREGLKVHPQFVGGRVALARALFEKKRYPEVIDELVSVTRDVPDNLAAQKLVAESALMLGRVSESLTAYKMLLYFNPTDAETAKIVSELESQAYEQGTLVLRRDPAPQKAAYRIAATREAIENDPELKRDFIIRKIETLQALLQQIERTRFRRDPA